MRDLRFPNESDDQFVARAERAAAVARLLIDAALANFDIQEHIADPRQLQTEESERRNPTVRVDYNEAFAVCGIGEGLQATKNKHWGSGPRILPLRPDDPVDPVRILYVFKEGSLYNRRFMQRRRLKELLGKRHRPLVTMAKGFTQLSFLDQLTTQEAYVIRQLLQMEPTEFWRACKGRTLIELPEKAGQLNKAVIASIKEKPKQLLLNFSPEHQTDD